MNSLLFRGTELTLPEIKGMDIGAQHPWNWEAKIQAAKYKTKARTPNLLQPLFWGCNCSGSAPQPFRCGRVHPSVSPVSCGVPWGAGWLYYCLHCVLTDLCSLLNHTALGSWHCYDGLLTTEPVAPICLLLPPACPSPSSVESLTLSSAFCTGNWLELPWGYFWYKLPGDFLWWSQRLLSRSVLGLLCPFVSQAGGTPAFCSPGLRWPALVSAPLLRNPSGELEPGRWRLLPHSTKMLCYWENGNCLRFGSWIESLVSVLTAVWWWLLKVPLAEHSLFLHP